MLQVYYWDHMTIDPPNQPNVGKYGSPQQVVSGSETTSPPVSLFQTALTTSPPWRLPALRVFLGAAGVPARHRPVESEAKRRTAGDGHFSIGTNGSMCLVFLLPVCEKTCVKLGCFF